MKRLNLVCTLLMSAIALHAAAPIPRPAPDFVIQEPSGRQTILAAEKG